MKYQIRKDHSSVNLYPHFYHENSNTLTVIMRRKYVKMKQDILILEKM